MSGDASSLALPIALLSAGLAAWLWVAPSEQPAARRLTTAVRTDRLVNRWLQLAGCLIVVGATVIGAGLSWGPAGAVVALALSIVALAAARLTALGRRQRAQLKMRSEVAIACSTIANQVRVGRIPAEALTIAAADAPVLQVAARVLEQGGDVVAALVRQSERPGCRGLRDLARAWRVGVQTGAPMADLLDQTARSLRADQAIERTVAAELAGPRASGKIMAGLPLCGIGLGYLLGGNPVQFLVAGPIGWVCLIGGSVLAAAGVLWIEWIARDLGGA